MQGKQGNSWRQMIPFVKEVFAESEGVNKGAEVNEVIKIDFDETGLIPFYNDFLQFRRIYRPTPVFKAPRPSEELRKSMSDSMFQFWANMDLREKIEFCKKRRNKQRKELYKGLTNIEYNYGYNSKKGINPFLGCKRPDMSKRRTPINCILIDFRKHSRKVNYAGVMNTRDFDSIW